ncbi:aldo/keto reductase [Sulfurimonas sp. NWX367]|uniref:aldo/keto reductase n=1 Tax=Sulfurimonas sp. NWX367 TaxID=2925413 RepID=UPI003204D242
MKYINFNGNEISKLSLGTVQFGLNYGISNSSGKPKQDEVNDIVGFVTQSGINCFDTAVAYGDSEIVLGKALNQKKSFHIVSKVKSDIFLSDVEKILFRSLDRLGYSKLFGFMLHDGELLFRWRDEYRDKVDRLKKYNLINHFGVSIYTNEEFDLAIENTSIEIIQIPFNLFDQRANNNSWFQKAKEANKLIFIRSVFLQGLFFMEIEKLTGTLMEAKGYLKQMNSMRETLDLSIADFAMAYVESIADDAVVLFGCDSLTQAKENIETYNKLPKLKEEILNNINRAFSNIPENIINPSRWNMQ